MSNHTREQLIPATKRFNRWQFIEAQNFFKELGDDAESREADFLHAIAAVGGGFAKIWHKGGEPHAMVSLLTEGIKTIKQFQPTYLDYELVEFVAHLETCLNEAKRWRRGDTKIFDRDLIPRLRFKKA